MEFSRPEYLSGLPLPSPWNLPDPGMEARSPALQAGSTPSEPRGKPNTSLVAQTLKNLLCIIPSPQMAGQLLQAVLLNFNLQSD